VRCVRSTQDVERALCDTTVILRCFYPSDYSRQGNYLTRPPENRTELDAASQIILGHFTSSKFLTSIKAN